MEPKIEQHDIYDFYFHKWFTLLIRRYLCGPEPDREGFRDKLRDMHERLSR